MNAKKNIDSQLELIKNDLINNFIRLGLATSKHGFENSIEKFIVEDGAHFKFGLKGAKYTYWLEHGRNPTSKNAAKGTPTLREIIRQWIDDKGITPEVRGTQKKAPSKDSLAYIISQKIHKEGIKVGTGHRNTGGLLSDIATQSRINLIAKEIGAGLLTDFKSEILKTFKK